ncbi:MAG: hypothetical protein ACFCD0_17875 [Gemmataceae bacterium]
MHRQLWLGSVVLSVMFVPVALGQDPIKPVQGLKPTTALFKKARRGKPLVIKSAEQVRNHFGKADAAKLNKAVDFKKQIVLVFAWRGSGQDKLNYSVAESFPEQITFQIIPGRTRDLRPHFYVYVLRSNVKWRVKFGR